MSQACVYCFRPKSTRTPRRNNALDGSLHTIERYALNGRSVVGSSYDARTDNLLPTLSVQTHLLIQKSVKETPSCKLIKVDDSNWNNLLQMIDIQDDLRISIALNMTTITEGTLMLHTYKLPTDRTVRLIDYYYVNQEECLSDDIETARKTLPYSLPNTNATHIITNVKRGFDFVMALEFPQNPNSDETDSILEKLCEYFAKPEVAFLSAADQLKINDLKLTIFTQITDIHSFAKLKNVSDICQRIHQFIDQNRYNVPLSYTLHPVKCIYHIDPYNERIFYRFDQSIIEGIEQKILSLFSKLNTINHLGHDNVLQQLPHCLESRAKDMYTDIQSNLVKSITDFRQGKSNLSLLDDELKDAEIKILELKKESIQTAILKVQTEEPVIDKLKTEHQIDCINAANSEGTSDHRKNPEGKLVSLDQAPISSPTVRSVVKAEEMNVLLVGETGVGKSTFINAFINYLAFHSLQQAATGEPIVLIPVSFVITSGDQFQEKIIEFGQFDTNENHNRLGESVTQHCRSYIFNIANNIKLRIIDTPGIGDTRGVEQDSKNIQHILSYTNSLPHLNAICFLLKPNTTRLHASFRSCFIQLFDFLGPAARDNIIFCFTNTRATFYAPGETGKLVREMLTRLPNDHIPSFDKRNTFCFDSESFRYLAIIKAKHKLELGDTEKLEFENSWKMSVTESIRLLDFIKLRPPYRMHEWHSIKHAQMMITLLVRPILETIRNALQNLVLRDRDNNRDTIGLKAHPISLPAWLCTVCSYETTRVDSISIVRQSIQYYRTSNECTRCHCDFDKHLPIFYELEHRSTGKKGDGFNLVTENMKQRLLNGSVIMSQFLLHTAHVSENPFLPWFDLLVQEEQKLSQKDRSNNFHLKLDKNMRDAKDEYENRTNDNQFDRDQIGLQVIYGCIEEVLAYSSIAEQMNATKASQMEMTKKDEHDVSSQYPRVAMTALRRRSTTNTDN